MCILNTILVIAEKVRVLHLRTSSKIVTPIFIIALACVFIFLFLKTPDNTLESSLTRFGLIILFTWIGTTGFLTLNEKCNAFFTVIINLLFFTALFQVSNLVKGFSDYPFSMEWSETSRFYYASLPFSKSIYGLRLPWSFMHPSRYLLLAIAFIFNRDSLEIHRAWQVGLSIVMPLGTAFAAARRIEDKQGIKWVLLTCWGFLFLNHGPVYYHLLICAIIVLIGFNTQKPIRSLLFTILASAWAGISRINWFPLPGVLAAILFILETPWHDEKEFIKNIRWPIIFIMAGLTASFLAQLVYVPISGNTNIKDFGSAFFSDLLWYRLLPNVNFQSGIVPGILVVSIFPLISIMFFIQENHFSLLQRLALTSALSVFFIGGLIVSVKIGGGSNLHNMDAFLLLVMVMTFYSFKNLQIENAAMFKQKWVLRFVLTGMIVSVFWQGQVWTARFSYNRDIAEAEIKKLEKDVLREANRGKEILFISQRHFLTFGKFDDLPLVADYELLTLMEMAMSHNKAYLERFQADIQAQRFGLIVAYKQYDLIKEKEQGFAEENNAWVSEISRPLLKYYMPITWLQQSGVQIYAPIKQ